MTTFKPGSSMPIASRNSARSSSSSNEISASIWLQSGTTIAFSSAANFLTASKCGLFSKPSSATLAIYIVGLSVIKPKPRTSLRSSSSRSAARAGLPSSSKGWIFSRTALVASASLSPPLADFVKRVIALATASKSASASSVLIVAMSSSGSIRPFT